jgi:hypothetical protein
LLVSQISSLHYGRLSSGGSDMAGRIGSVQEAQDGHTRRGDRLAPLDAAIERQKLLAKVFGRVFAGVIQIALSLAGFWVCVASGWTLWLRIPVLVLAVFFGIGGLRAAAWHRGLSGE